MIELGYMAKRIALRPEGLDVPAVRNIYAVSDCVSDDINYWKHNGFWFFDSPTEIREIASANDIDLSSTSLLYDQRGS